MNKQGILGTAIAVAVAASILVATDEPAGIETTTDNLASSSRIPAVLSTGQPDAVLGVSSTEANTAPVQDIQGLRVQATIAEQAPLSTKAVASVNHAEKAALSQAHSKMSAPVAALAARGGDQMVDLIISFSSHPELFQDDTIAKLGGEIVRSYSALKMRAIRLPASAIESLAVEADILNLALDAPVSSASASARQTAGLPSGSSANAFAVNPGIGIAVLDSGVADHLDINLASRVDVRALTAAPIETYRDEFSDLAANNSNGTLNWSNQPWIETGDNGSPSGGSITIETDYCPDSQSRCVEFDARGGVNDALEREVDLADAQSATLVFDYRLYDIDSSAEFVLEVSANGGASWASQPLAVYDSAALVFGESVDLTPYVSDNTRIRFRVTDYDPEAHLYLDNIEVQVDRGNVVTLRDNFDAISYSNSDGTEDWSTGGWVETGDNGTASGGAITVEVDYCPDYQSQCIEFDARGGVNDSIERAIDLSGAIAAELSFDYRLNYIHDDATFVLEASSNGGASWSAQPLAVYANEELVFGETVDLTPYISADTRIRFRITDSDEDAHLTIDNVEVRITDGEDNDTYGHGTHVAGIIGGNGSLSNGNYRGVAPGASIHAVRVLDRRGRGKTSDAIAGLDWVLNNATTHGIRIVNLSFGKGVEESNEHDPLVLAVEAVWDAGIVVLLLPATTAVTAT